jgi:hypothetical protein
MSAQTKGVDVLEVLRSRFEGCDPDEGFAGGAFLHPADAKMIHTAIADLIEAAQAAIEAIEDGDAQSARNELVVGLAGLGGAK